SSAPTARSAECTYFPRPTTAGARPYRNGPARFRAPPPCPGSRQRRQGSGPTSTAAPRSDGQRAALGGAHEASPTAALRPHPRSRRPKVQHSGIVTSRRGEDDPLSQERAERILSMEGRDSLGDEQGGLA